MLVLGIESATRASGVALADEAGLRAERTLVAPMRTLEWLVAAIDGMLRDARLGPDDVQGVAVSVGPGSFTGLRIGIAAAQAWARARGLPACGVSTLEAMAAGMPGADAVAPILDASRGEVTAALFVRRGDEWIRCVEEITAPPDQILARLQACGVGPDAMLLTGTGLARYGEMFVESLPGSRVADRALWAPRAAAVAALGRRRLLRGGERLYEIQPRYARAPALRPRGDPAAHAQGGGAQ
jgi:tRNA threonylcarbamoyladenosine biosynthesis protein TsaB